MFQIAHESCHVTLLFMYRLQIPERVVILDELDESGSLFIVLDCELGVKSGVRVLLVELALCLLFVSGLLHDVRVAVLKGLPSLVVLPVVIDVVNE